MVSASRVASVGLRSRPTDQIRHSTQETYFKTTLQRWDLMMRVGEILLICANLLSDLKSRATRIFTMNGLNCTPPISKVIADDTLQGLHKMLPVTNVIVIELDHTDGFKPEQMLALSEVKSAALEQGTLRVGVHDPAARPAFFAGWPRKGIRTIMFRANSRI